MTNFFREVRNVTVEQNLIDMAKQKSARLNAGPVKFVEAIWLYQCTELVSPFYFSLTL